MEETVRLRRLLDETMRKQEEKQIRYKEFSALEEKFYNLSNIIEGLKVDNADLQKTVDKQ